MPLDDFRWIARQCKGKTFQIALGGCGDPDQHEEFEGILQACVENDIVPNFTTSGLGMTRDLAKTCRKYCGAVAVSWYRSDHTLRAISLLLAEGVKTNVHYVLSKDSVREALDRLRADAGEWSVQLPPEALTLEQAWNSEEFERFRGVLRTACVECEKRELCMGGCPIVPEIVLCPHKAL